MSKKEKALAESIDRLKRFAKGEGAWTIWLSGHESINVDGLRRDLKRLLREAGHG